MKKILFLIPNLGGGGAEKVLVNLVNNLDKSKYDITIRTLFKSGVNSKHLHSDIHLIEGQFKQFRGNIHLLKLFSPKFLYGFFIKGKYDIVISYLEGPTARIVSGCNDKTIKTVSWIHIEHANIKSLSHSFRSVKEAKKCYGKYDLIVCVANTVKDNFLQISELKNKCVVLYNTNETDLIENKSREKMEKVFSDKLNVISIGRLMPQKGYDRLIKVHSNLINEGIEHHIYILGTGEELDNLKKLIRECRVEETFHFLGFLDNPYKYLKNADLFVCSSRKEGFSTAVTEALVVGTPVVSTCCSGAYELLGYNNEYGIVTENSEEGIYNGLKQMISNKDLLEHYKKQAEIRGKGFNKENTILAVQDMLESL